MEYTGGWQKKFLQLCTYMNRRLNVQEGLVIRGKLEQEKRPQSDFPLRVEFISNQYLIKSCKMRLSASPCLSI